MLMLPTMGSYNLKLIQNLEVMFSKSIRLVSLMSHFIELMSQVKSISCRVFCWSCPVMQDPFRDDEASSNAQVIICIVNCVDTPLFARPIGCQVIPGYGNPQKRWTTFGSYLFKYYCIKYQTFHQVCEKASQ